jgi:hypothetical protein
METHRLLPHVRERVRFHEIYAQWLSKANEQDCNQLDQARAQHVTEVEPLHMFIQRCLRQCPQDLPASLVQQLEASNWPTSRVCA